MKIAPRQLSIFVAIASEGSITAAAERLYLTKPAVSMALSELERQLGHVLFDRHKNRLYINDLGKRLLPMADELLARHREVEALFSSDGDVLRGQLRIGASHTIGNQLLPWLLRDFRDATGHRDQRVSLANSRDVCAALERFELDIGLIEGEAQSGELEVIDWCRDRLLVVAGHDHPLASWEQEGPLPVSALEGQAWVLREQGSGTREQFMRALSTRLERWEASLELNSAEAIINATAAGLGLTCVSEREASHALRDGRLVELEIMLEDGSRLVIERLFHLLVHRDKYRSALVKRFIEFCLAREE
ncbi:LysR substrate-binding domain-containing protein [Halotalea alkalilenta]|uniref:XRE family transcriptional regulator n=1 Tax=Halotalea alkalilenta TaxID=376489 RepID=A0A172YC53_9GAMM|nr:LysR substrate-binding domain-containing protein [Halotalea alkalilenta]ANF56813.1 XRE family transcriptional regulator [Halotalea alkalilenta]